MRTMTLVMVLFLVAGCTVDLSGHPGRAVTSNGYVYDYPYFLPENLPGDGRFHEVRRVWTDDGWGWAYVGSDEKPVKRREDSELVYVVGDHIQPYYGWTKPLFGQSEVGQPYATVFVCDRDEPADRYNPCDSALTRQHPMVWSGVTYKSEDGTSNISNQTAGFYRLDDSRLEEVWRLVTERGR